MAQKIKEVTVNVCDVCLKEDVPDDGFFTVALEIEGDRLDADVCKECDDLFIAIVDRCKIKPPVHQCWCGRVFSSEQGLAIHAGRMGHGGRR
jgi:hypothetical protein